MVFRKILRTAAKIFIPLVFGGFLIWFLYRDLDLTEIWTVIKKGVRYDIILFSLLFGLGGNIMRGLRWALLIDPLNTPYKKSNAINATLGTYAVNLVFPRVGEVWRCGVLAKYDKIPFSKLFGTLLIDRVSDTLVVGLLTFLIFIFNIGFFNTLFAHNPVLANGVYSMFNSIWIYVTILISSIIIWVVLRYMKRFTLVQKARNMLGNIWSGIKTVWLMEHKIKFLLYTVLIWTGYFFYFYITFYAFEFTRGLGITVGLIAFTMSSIGVAVPVQGNIGPWHFMVIATLVCFGVTSNDAAAFALVVHAIQTIWIGLCGLFGIVALPFTNKHAGSK